MRDDTVSGLMAFGCLFAFVAVGLVMVLSIVLLIRALG